MISSNGSNEEDTAREYHGATASGEDVASSSSNIVFHIQGSNEASPDQKSPGEIKVRIYNCLRACVCVCVYACVCACVCMCVYHSLENFRLELFRC